MIKHPMDSLRIPGNRRKSLTIPQNFKNSKESQGIPKNPREPQREQIKVKLEASQEFQWPDSSLIGS